jgi:hypothetical protein
MSADSLGGGKVVVDDRGNVGIGTTEPSEKLEVNGTVKATKFVSDGFRLDQPTWWRWCRGWAFT